MPGLTHAPPPRGPDIAPDLGPRDFHTRWRLTGPPQRPPASVPPRIDALLGPAHGTALLLGVTPEYAALDRTLVAVDWNRHMIDGVWPGDTARRRALVGDWRAMPLPDASVACALGDGPLTMLHWPHDIAPFAAELRRVLAPGGRVVMRCFACDGVTAPHRDPAALPSFHAYKFLHNMAIAAAHPHAAVRSDASWHAFAAHWPDRQRLADITGWSLAAIAEIDSYRGQSSVHSYPSRAMIRVAFDALGFAVAFDEGAGYPLAGYCPIVILTPR